MIKNKQQNNSIFFSQPNVLRVVKSSHMTRTGCLANIEEKRSLFRCKCKWEVILKLIL